MYLACSRIGAVMNPLMHIFRERELPRSCSHTAGSKLIVVPRQFRGFGFEKMLRDLQPSLPDLKHVLAIGGDGPDSFEARLTTHRLGARSPMPGRSCRRTRPGPARRHAVDLHVGHHRRAEGGHAWSANTVMSNIVPYAARLRLGRDDIVLMASPMAHQTGFMYGLMIADHARGERAYCLGTSGPDPAGRSTRFASRAPPSRWHPPPFLTDLSRAVTQSGKSMPSLRIFLCAGAPIPGAARRAGTRFARRERSSRRGE